MNSKHVKSFALTGIGIALIVLAPPSAAGVAISGVCFCAATYYAWAADRKD